MFGSNDYPDLCASASASFHTSKINTDFATIQTTVELADNVIIVLSNVKNEVDKHNLLLFQLPVDQLSSLTRQIVSNPKLQPALKQREELADLIFRSIFPIVGLYPHPNHYQDALKSVWRAYPHLASLVEDRTALKVVTFGVNNFYFFIISLFLFLMQFS